MNTFIFRRNVMDQDDVYTVLRCLWILFLVTVVPVVVAYVVSLPFINANYIINTSELLFALYLLQPGVMAWALSQWHTTLLFVYFQSVADYYYLLMGWSTREVAIIDTYLFWVVFLALEALMISLVMAVYSD